RKPSGKIGGSGQSTRSALRLEMFSLTGKRVSQRQGRSDKRPSLESDGSISSPFRRFAVSPFRSYFATKGGQVCKTRTQLFPNLFFDLVWIARTVDQYNSLWLVRCELAISFANALIEFR